MKLNKKILEELILEVIVEASVMDKTIKYKDADGNEKEATVGGILKKGEEHPAHKQAQQMVDKEKSGGKVQKAKNFFKSLNPFGREKRRKAKATADAEATAETGKIAKSIRQRRNRETFEKLSVTAQDAIDDVQGVLGIHSDEGGVFTAIDFKDLEDYEDDRADVIDQIISSPTLKKQISAKKLKSLYAMYHDAIADADESPTDDGPPKITGDEAESKGMEFFRGYNDAKESIEALFGNAQSSGMDKHISNYSLNPKDRSITYNFGKDVGIHGGEGGLEVKIDKRGVVSVDGKNVPPYEADEMIQKVVADDKSKDESVISKLTKEFKEYEIYNKNLRKL